MQYVIVGYRQPKSKFIAHHLVSRITAGRVVVLSPRPLAILAPLVREWKKQIYAKKKELSSTSDYQKRREISELIAQMEKVAFAACSPQKPVWRDVIVTRPEHGAFFMRDCATVYTLMRLTPQEDKLFTVALRADSHLIILPEEDA